MINRAAKEVIIRRPRRILVLTTTYPSNETDPSGVFIAKLLGALSNRGYKIKVVAPSNGLAYGRGSLNGIETVRFGYFFPRSLEKLTTQAGGIPENMKSSWLAKIQLLPMMSNFLLKSTAESRNSDLIYANWIGAGLIGALTNWFTGKPLVVSFRGDDGYLARDRAVWKTITQWVISRATAIAPVSRELLEILMELGAPSHKCRLPKFGVDTGMFHPAERKSDSETVELLFVGSLIPRKGLHDLLKAISAANLEKARLSVIGEGPSGAEFKNLAKVLGIESRVEWHGGMPPQQVAEVMRNADILCLPSYMEGRPNVVNEAMASGIPVISTRIGGIPDMVEEGNTALLHDAGNVDELATHLKTLVNNKDMRKRMGQSGREFLINTGVSWDATAEEFDDIFIRSVCKR